MKKSLAPLAITALLLAGCSAPAEGSNPDTATTPPSPSPAPVQTVTVTATATPTPEPAPEPSAASRIEPGDDARIDGIFLDRIREGTSQLSEVPDAQLLETAGLTCELLDAGTTKDQFFEEMKGNADGNLVVIQAQVAVFGAAIGAYCPKHIDKL